MTSSRSTVPSLSHAGSVVALAATLALAACAARGPLPELETARSTVNAASANPEVAKHAALELKTATDTLARADRTWSEDGDQTEAQHLSYLAQKQAETATALTKARAADEHMKDLSSQADRMRLQARTAEANTARNQARAAQANANRANARVAGLEAQIKELQAQQTERGLLVTLGDVLFEFNKFELLPTAVPSLDKLAAFLREFPDRKLLIEGYTDSVGNSGYNQRLSQRRAQAVTQALQMRGVGAERMTTRGYGESYPVANNGTPEGRALNRRVEVVIADENGVLRSRP